MNHQIETQMENLLNQKSAGKFVYSLFLRENLTRYPNCPYMVESKVLTPKAHYRKEKIQNRFVFKTIEEAADYLDKAIQSIEKRIQSELERKQQRDAINKSIVASEHFKVGDIIVNTWGYEQTNVNFYQVTEVKNKMITVVSIYGKRVENSEQANGMACDVVPDKDNFIPEDASFYQKYNLRLKPVYNNNIFICNRDSYFDMHKWDGRPQYNSWYA